MERKVVLFLLTPRAGEWNHRYIVPQGISWNDTFLGECYEKILQFPNKGKVFSCDATQSGGRVGKEILVLYSDTFDILPEQERQEVVIRLKRWFDTQREDLIQRKVNWPEEGRPQVIPRLELSNLYADVLQCMKVDLCEGAKECMTKTKPKSTSFWKKGILWGIVMMCMLAGFLGIYLALPQETTSNPFPDFWNTFQGWVIPSPPADETWKTCEKLFLWSEQKPFNRENLKAAFDDAWRMSGQNTLDALGDYLNHPDVQVLLESQKNNQLLVLGAVTEDTKASWKMLDGVDPVKFRKAVWALEQLRVHKAEIPEECGILGEVLPQVSIEYPPNYAGQVELIMDYPPLFFIATQKESYSDLRHAEILRKFYMDATRTYTGSKENLSKKPFAELILTAKEDGKFYSEKMKSTDTISLDDLFQCGD